MKIINSSSIDSFNKIVASCEARFSFVNKKLPWIEPSINMIHLDAIRAFVFGASLSSLSSSMFLLEHTLRMAIWDHNDAGCLRRTPTKDILNATLGKLIKDNKYQNARNKLITEEKDKEWWEAITESVRNKVAHIDYPSIFRIVQALNLKEEYAYSGFEDNVWNPENPSSWGMFWHRFGDKLASDIIMQSVSQVEKIIYKTKWKSDVSWWISQQVEYDCFFSQKWDFENLQMSLKKYYGGQV